jgi:putative redox protein
MDQEWKEITAYWQGEQGFIGENSKGITVQMGLVQSQPGISPMELLLIGVAGCTGMDVASMLSKMRQQLTDFRITVRGLRAEQHPRIFTEIEVLYELWGRDLSVKSVEDAIALSEEKYCSVGAMLRASAKIRSSYFIHPVVVEE